MLQNIIEISRTWLKKGFGKALERSIELMAMCLTLWFFQWTKMIKNHCHSVHHNRPKTFSKAFYSKAQMFQSKLPNFSAQITGEL